MRIKIDKAKMRALRDHLARGEDCEEMESGEYLIAPDDDIEMEIALADDAIDVLCAVKLQYDEESDGWYIAQRLEEREEILRLAKTWLETI
ncbi:MAG: hypothetical protein ACOYI8_02345 [Christensenellales bacterium]|jgi:hypothetical protein